MGTRRFRIIFTVSFGLALIAGAAAGVLATRFSSPAVVMPGVSTLDDLQLTPEQREQMKQIWEEVRNSSDDLYNQAQKLQREHDQKVLNLLNPEQKKQFEDIYNQDRDSYSQLMAKRQIALKKAIENTKKLLSDSQRQKYDAILESRLGRNAEPGTVWLSASPATQPAGPENN